MSRMKQESIEPEDQRLRSLLRESIPQQSLPLGFRQSVWRKIETANVAKQPLLAQGWFDNAIAWLLRPWMALTVGAAMVVLGSSWGVVDGIASSKHAAQERYIASVSPLTTSR